MNVTEADTFGVRYEGVIDPTAPLDDDANWRPYWIAPALSLDEAKVWRDVYAQANEGVPYARNFVVVYAPPVDWQVWVDADPDDEPTS
ncbi:hypothetical protein PBI_KESHU_29 [Mycobacterium phage Keshu]|uniref:Uncharacterized protein n=1 Tax=Mycobacterium phage Keshu TaxID=1567471 RepID=A0A0B5A372_9CAUD|nr:hypothetical protein PBI_KESHU_29 [Mycobacterium phage Keshu]AJD82249.1 hypothetical protein PBI_KESHU_29 [Mycobacterium phage Keshu]